MHVPKSAAKPPGRKLIKRLPDRTKWILLAILAIVLIAYALGVFAYGIVAKIEHMATKEWAAISFFSIIILTGGILVLGEAWRIRLTIEMRKEMRREIRRLRRKRRFEPNKAKQPEKKAAENK